MQIYVKGIDIPTSDTAQPVDASDDAAVEHVFNWGNFKERRAEGVQPITRHGVSTESSPLRKIPVYREAKVLPVVCDGASIDPQGDPFAPFPYKLGTDYKHSADIFSGDGRHIVRFLSKRSQGDLPANEMLFTARMMTRSFFFLAISQYVVPLWHRVYNGGSATDDEGLGEAAIDLLDMYDSMLEKTGIEDFGRYDEIAAQVMATRRRPLGYFTNVTEDKMAIFIHLKPAQNPKLSYRVAVLNQENFICYEEMLFTAKLMCASHHFASYALDAITCLSTFYPPLVAYFNGDSKETQQEYSWQLFQGETGIDAPDILLKNYQETLGELYKGAPKEITLYEPQPAVYDPSLGKSSY